MQTKISIEDVTAFIKANGVLKGWTDNQIKSEVFKALDTGLLAYTTDDNNNLTGICFARSGTECPQSASNLLTCCVYRRKKRVLKTDA
jgi:hypothetical protein